MAKPARRVYRCGVGLPQVGACVIRNLSPALGAGGSISTFYGPREPQCR